MELSLLGKRAIVCGSTQGIGKAIAIALANLGANITLIARNTQKLDVIKRGLAQDQGQIHHCLTADFAHPEQLKEILSLYVNEPQTVNILVNNTGGPPAGPITNATEEEFTQAFANHLLCNHILAQAVLPGMKESGYGRIVNIISTSVKQPIAGLGVSNTTRGAVASWAKTLSNEVGPSGITVNNVLPGATATKRLSSIITNKAKKSGKTEVDVIKDMKANIPLRRFAKPEETADLVAFLVSPAAAYITGTSIPVDGGRTSSL